MALLTALGAGDCGSGAVLTADIKDSTMTATGERRRDGPAGESAGVTSRPNGIDRDAARSGVRRPSPNGMDRKRSPAQSNQRAERQGSQHQKRIGHRHRTAGE